VPLSAEEVERVGKYLAGAGLREAAGRQASPGPLVRAGESRSAEDETPGREGISGSSAWNLT
jgi:hypothetical protein